ncbi:MAG: 16S rRNA (cytosine(1402)-N(4))-methyltransferase RsmH [Anaerolineae bacterium]|jgi:16S rRNA (cytosine1402-N4)-methyltransferase|nr:16S rRNA (cytosine(1402)-N(4))-methyltransferase RsmH [Chloroflexota bacterium]
MSHADGLASAQERQWEHTPVLLEEVLQWLAPRPNARLIDATVGLGGHARRLLESSAPDGRLLALDADPRALELARQNLAPFGQRVTFVHGRHVDLGRLAEEAGFTACDGILFDLGVSSLQLDDARRGFSFREAGPLDMRMDPTGALTADAVVNDWSEEDLARVIAEYGEERYARRVARFIVRERPVADTAHLAAIVARAVRTSGTIHPATRTFQGIRIAVNSELSSLEQALPQALQLLVPGGSLAVISFHSLEDRIVKRWMTREAEGCICPPRVLVCECGHTAQLERPFKRPVMAGSAEVARNPRSRSARLRVARRLPVSEAQV